MRKEFTCFCIAIFFTDLRPPNSPDINPVDYMMGSDAWVVRQITGFYC